MEQGALLISKVGGIPLSSVPVKRNVRLEILDILGPSFGTIQPFTWMVQVLFLRPLKTTVLPVLPLCEVLKFCAWLGSATSMLLCF